MCQKNSEARQSSFVRTRGNEDDEIEDGLAVGGPANFRRNVVYPEQNFAALSLRGSQHPSSNSSELPPHPFYRQIDIKDDQLPTYAELMEKEARKEAASSTF